MPPTISEAEWEVMRVFWALEGATAQRVIEELGDDVSWKPKTVKTLINRLLKKGAIGFETRGREYFYRPQVAEGECVRAETRSFLDRFFGGALAPMVAHLAGDKPLDKKDIEALRQLLTAEESKQKRSRKVRSRS